MADPFSTAAAAISLVDIVIKSAREISAIIAALKGAPENLHRAHERVCEVRSLLEHLTRLENSYRLRPIRQVNPQSLASICNIVKSIDSDLKLLRSKIEEPIINTDPLSRRVLKVFRFSRREESIDKIWSRLDHRVTLINGHLSALGRDNDITSRTLLETINDTSQGLVQELRTNTSVSQQLLRGQEELRDGVLDVRARLHNRPQIYPRVHIYEGSANDAADVLSMVRRLLPSARPGAYLPGTNIGHMIWVEEKLLDILSSAYELAGSERESGQLLVPYGTRRVTQPIGLQALHFFNAQSSSVLQRQLDRLRKREMRVRQNDETEILVPFPEGNLFVRITNECHVSWDNSSCTLRGFRVFFASETSYDLPGISIAFIESSNNGLKIPPAIRTFGIVPRECKIIEHILHGNTQEVQAVLERGECSARDRDLHGNSLLLYAIRHMRYDICCLLLGLGADPIDCDARGNTALTCFLKCWDLGDNTLPFEDFIRLFGANGCFAYELLVKRMDYSGRTIVVFSCSPLFTALRRLRDRRANPDHFRILLNHTSEVNPIRGTGTMLLEIAANNVHYSKIGSVVRALLYAGADARSTDIQGSGVLSYYCRSLSSCRGYLSDGKAEESIVELLVELIAHGASPSGWKASLPTDLALAPAFWGLWCRALETAGIDIEGLLKNDDGVLGLQSPSAQDVEELLGDITSPHLVTSEFLVDNRPQGICNLCEGGIGPCYFRPPFDLFSRYVTPANRKHRVMCRHQDGLPCSNYISANTCTRIDHDMDGFPDLTATSISVRKWAAYRLWRDGYLDTPEQAEFWATDVKTREASTSFDYLSAIRL